MQYILTQQEYEALQRDKKLRTEGQTEELQAFCTLAAMHIPVPRPWAQDKTPAPWGCILGPREQDPGYCDDCPAQNLCPSKGKEWSQ
ncbi:MAG: Aeromonas virus 65 [Pseudomonadota bacterium]|jgi:hypothetical protein